MRAVPQTRPSGHREQNPYLGQARAPEILPFSEDHRGGFPRTIRVLTPIRTIF
jgi:hypothetical protein